VEAGAPQAEPAARAFVEAYAVALQRDGDIGFARWLLDMHDRHTDARAARYWELVGIIIDRRPTPEQQAEIGLYPWLIEALRAMDARDA
jgi:hypothetical protein